MVIHKYVKKYKLFEFSYRKSSSKQVNLNLQICFDGANFDSLKKKMLKNVLLKIWVVDFWKLTPTKWQEYFGLLINFDCYLRN